MIKRRYEYCAEAKMIIDNELDNYVEDVVERLNTQDSNKKDLLKQYHLLEDEIRQKEQQIAELKKALELACKPRDDWGGREYDDPYTNYYDYFLDKAKEMLKNE